MKLPPRVEEAVRLAVYGQKEAAHQMGVSVQTVKNHLSIAYHLLGVGSLVEAYLVLGWLRIPGVDAERVFDTRLTA